MSQTNFRLFFLDNVLDFLWRQWSSLGVAGGSRQGDAWIIDPEALLVFSLSMSRFEPRLFDEILDWLVINGKFIDIQRLRALLRTQDEKTQRLVRAVACFVSHEAKTYQRKWQPLSESKSLKSREPKGSIVRSEDPVKYGAGKMNTEALFVTKERAPYPKPKTVSAIFHRYGFLREDFILRKMSRPVSVNTPNNIRFLLRSLFGIGSRAECVLYLLTHETGHPAEVAAAIGISVRGTQDALIELAESGLVFTRIKGKRKIEYYLNKNKWEIFLFGPDYSEIKLLTYINWIALFSALNNVWQVLNEVEKAESEYMRSSKLRQAMETITQEFSASGVTLPPVPGKEVRPQEYEAEFQKFVKRVLGA